MAELTFSTLLRRYRVDAFVARGAMAELYRGFDARRKKTVALKFLREDYALDREFERRFRREAAVLEKLSHPNIVRFHELRRADHMLFMVMDFVEGVNLWRYLFDHGALPPGEALAILKPLASALQHAHDRGVIHNDVKPSNVILSDDDHVLLSDFGVAALVDSDSATAPPHAMLGGTPAYMSPERCAGKFVDGRSDQYSLGVLAYEILVAKRPFLGESPGVTASLLSERVRTEHLSIAPAAPSACNPDLPPDLDEVLLRALSKRPQERYKSPLQFVEALEHAFPGVTATMPKVRTAAVEPDTRLKVKQPLSISRGGIGIARTVRRLTVAGALLFSIAVLFQALASSARLEKKIFFEYLPNLRNNIVLGGAPFLIKVMSLDEWEELKSWETYPITEPAVAGRESTTPGVRTVEPEAEGTTAVQETSAEPSVAPTIKMVLAGEKSWRPRLSVAWSPDQSMVAVGNDASEFQLWDVASGELLRVLEAQPAFGRTVNVAWSPDSNTLATPNGFGRIQLWEAASGEKLRMLQDDSITELIISVAWSPDGKILASGSDNNFYDDDNNVQLWDVESGELLRVLAGHDSNVYSLAWSPDGQTLASASGDPLRATNTVRLWDAASGELLRVLAGHESSVYSLAWSPDGRTLASGGRDNTVRLWDAESGAKLLLLDRYESNVYSVTWSQDGSYLAAGLGDGTIQIWSPDIGMHVAALAEHEGGVFSVAWSPDSTTLASAGGDGRALLWDISGEAPEVPEKQSSPVVTPTTVPGTAGVLIGSYRSGNAFAWAPDGHTIATDGCGNSNFDEQCARPQVILWDAESRQQLQVLDIQMDIDPLYNVFKSIAWSPDGSQLAIGIADGSIRLWDIEGAVEIWKFEGEPCDPYWTMHCDFGGSLRSVAWSPDGSYIASSDMHGVVTLWGATSLKPLQVIKVQHEIYDLDGFLAVYSVAWSPDSSKLATGVDDGTIRIWEVPSGEQIRVLQGHVGASAFVGNSMGDLESVTDRLSEYDKVYLSVMWSPDGSTLASGGGDGTVRLWDAESGTPLNILSVEDANSGASMFNRNTVSKVAWSPDSGTVAAGMGDDTIRLWDIEKGVQLTVLGPVNSTWPGVTSVAWSPDGRTLGSTHQYDNSVWLWDVSDVIEKSGQSNRSPSTIVKVSTANLRSGPGTAYAVDAQLEYGTQVTIFERAAQYPIPDATGAICVTLYSDANGNGVLDTGEQLVAGGVFNLVNLDSSETLETYVTDGSSEPYCFVDLQTGTFRVISAAPVGYTPTTRVDWDLTLATGSTASLEFGAQLTSENLSPSTDVPESTPPACEESEPSMLSKGQSAVVHWGGPEGAKLRSEARVPQDYNANIVAVLHQGDILTVIDGPECSHGGYWWYVSSDFGDLGWVREAVGEDILVTPLTGNSAWFRVVVDDTTQGGWISSTVIHIDFIPEIISIADLIPPLPTPTDNAMATATTSAVVSSERKHEDELLAADAYARGKEELTNENYDLALDAFDNAIVLASANPVMQAHIYRARSITLMRSDQQELAEEAMRTAIRLDPTNACHYSDLGGIILDRELQSKKLTPTEALTYLDKAIEMDPINGYVYLSRAPAVRVLEQMEDLAMASDLGCEEGDYSGCYSQYCEALPEYD